MKKILTPLLFLIVFVKAYAQPTTITIGTFTGPICAGATSSVTYNSTGGGTDTYISTNVFYVEISNINTNASWSGVHIGTLLGFARSGTVSLSFPSTLASGTYYLRIVASNPNLTSGATAGFIVNAAPSINISPVSSVCLATNTLDVNYTLPTGSPNQYSVTWNAAALAAGLSNVALTSLPASKIVLSGLSGVPVGQYTGSIVVRNSTTGCSRDVTTETVCGVAAENSNVTLTSPTGLPFTNISFASYGNGTGTCGNFTKGSCDAATSIPEINTRCIGSASCTVPATNVVFGDPCSGTIKNLLVELEAATFSIIVSPTSASITATKPVICSGEYTTLTATPGQTYEWRQSPSNTIIATTQSITVNPASTSTYTCVVSNLGCNTSTGSITITVNASPTATLSSLVPRVCSGITSYNLGLSSVVNSPNQYSVDWGDNVTTMTDIPFTALTGNSIAITGITGTAGTYPATIYLRNTTTGCVGNVTGATVCNSASEGSSLSLTAPAGSNFISIPFASFGTPTGGCGGFATGSCHFANSISTVRASAYNNNSFSIVAHGSVFSPDPCSSTIKTLAVQAIYSSFSLSVVAGTAPTVNAVTNPASVCPAVSFTTVTFSGTGTPTYNWTNSNTTINLAASGTGNIAAFAGANNTLAANTSTVTVTPTNGTCSGTSRTFTYTVNPGPLVNAGTALADICKGGTSAALGGSVSGTTTTGTWSSSAAGTFTPNATTLNATWTPPVAYTGNATLTLTSTGGTCGPRSDFKTINILAPTVSAGAALAGICQGATSAALGGSIGGTATGGTWSTTAGGTFNPNATTLNATWAPPAAFTGTATLTLTTSGGSCGTVNASKTIEIVAPLAATGTITGSDEVCRPVTNGAYSISPVAGASSYSWAYSGTGATITGTSNSVTVNFSNAATSGNLTVTPSFENCAGTTASLAITVRTGAPGQPANTFTLASPVCQGSTGNSYTVGASANATCYLWTYGGTGAAITGNTQTVSVDFNSTATSGTFSVRGVNACGNSAIRTSGTVTVNQLPTVSAGAAMSAICQGGTSVGLGGARGGSATGSTWTSNSGGTFSPNATTLNATWTPSAAFTGTATLTLTTSGGSCGTVNASKTIEVIAPLAVTGAITGNNELCRPVNNIAYSVSPVSGASSYTWAYSGNGETITGTSNSVTINFSNAATSGNLTVTPVYGNCSGTTSTLPVVIRTGVPGQPANTFTLATPVCQGSTGNSYSAGTSTNATSYSWTYNNTGATITGNAQTVSVDFSSSAVSSNFTVSGVNACGAGATRTSGTVTVNQLPTVSAGAVMSDICQGGTSTGLGGARGGSATGSTWTSNSGGTFTPNATTLNATWTPSAAFSGTAMLTLTTSGGSCGTVNAAKTIDVDATPTVSAGGALSGICQGGTSAALGGSVGGSATSGTWSTTAGGTFNPDATTLNATWTPPAGYSGTATLLLTTLGGACTSVSANKSIVVNSTPTVYTVTGGIANCGSGTIGISGSQVGYEYLLYLNAAYTGLNFAGTGNVISGPSNTVGTYTILARNTANTNCTANMSGTFVIYAVPATPTITGTTTYTYNDNLSLTANSVTPGVTYAWTPPGTATSILGLTTSNITKSGIKIADAGSYSVVASANGCASAAANTSITVNQKALTIAGLSGVNKVYDGNTTAATTGTATLNGIVSPDVVTLSGTITRTFSNKNVGTGKAITITGYTLSGTNAGNYTVSQPTGLTGDITAKPLTVTGAAAAGKVYDGTTGTTITGTLTGIVSPDVVTLIGTGTFANANVGVNKAVTSTSTLGGADAGNYSLTQPTGLTATITGKALTIAGLSGVNKVYDGNITAATTGTATLNGIVSPDVVTLSGTITRTFSNKNVGTGKAITITGYTLSGANAGNYTVSQPTGLTGDITAKPLTVTGAAAAGKVYDGTTGTTITGTLTGIVSPDVVTLIGTGTFANANVGVNKAVTSTSTLGGADAGNYSLTQPTGLTATITGKALTITGLSGVSKVYDGNTTASVTGTAALSGIVSPDVVTIGSAGTFTFADKNVGTGKAITATGYTIAGANAGNYTLTQPTGLTGNITAKPLTVTGAAAAGKVYDGTTGTTITGTLTGIVSPDVVTLIGTGTFANANVGVNKAVTSTSTLGGADAGNYSLTQPTGLTATITGKALTITGLSGVSKVYDGNTTASVTGTAALSGIVSPDVVTIGSAGTFTFADKNVGIGKTITATGYTITGSGAGNYTLTQPTATANITGKALTITADSRSKCFSNTVTFAGTEFTSTGLINSDVITSVTLTSAGSSAGATVAGSPYSIVPSTAVGSGLSNYSINYVNGVLTINPISYTWTGGTSTDWITGSNWVCGVAPSASTHDVTISGTVNSPVLPTSATTIIGGLIIGTGATLSLPGSSTLVVNGNWSNSGTFLSSTGLVEFKGSSPQTLVKTNGTESFYNVNLEGASLAVNSDVEIKGSGTLLIKTGTLDVTPGKRMILRSPAPLTEGGTDRTARLGKVTGSITAGSNFEVERYVDVPSIRTGLFGNAGTKAVVLMSPAVKNLTLSGLSGLLLNYAVNISSYSELNATGLNTGWRYGFSGTSPLYSGKGYKLTVGRDNTDDLMSVTGPVCTGTVSVPVTYTPQATEGWNLIGNPYPCEINWETLYNNNSTVLSPNLYMMDPYNASNNNSSYYVYQANTGITTDPRSLSGRTTANGKYIASSQGFFITAIQSGNVHFSESVKPDAPYENVYANFRQEANRLIRIQVTDSNSVSETVVNFNANAKDSYDPLYDAESISSGTINLYTIAGKKKLVINGLSQSTSVDIPLVVESARKGFKKFRVTEQSLEGAKCYLYDTYLKKHMLLEQGNEYGFEYTADALSGSENRFKIVSKLPVITSYTNTAEERVNAGKPFIHPNPSSDHRFSIDLPQPHDIIGIEILDLAGNLVYSDSDTKSTLSLKVELPDSLSAGIYTVRYITKDKVSTDKILLVK